MIKAFIFDIGGTLVKTDEAILDALEQSLNKNGLTLVDKGKVILTFGTSMPLIVRTAVELSYSGDDIESMIKKCYNSYCSIFPKKVASDFRVFPTVTNALHFLKNKAIKLAIVTGMIKEEAGFILGKVNLLQYFDAITARDEVISSRPNPEALFLAMQRLGLEKDACKDCIYVGDTVVDIQMAQNAKMRAVCVKTELQDNKLLENEKPDYFVDSFSEMITNLSHQL